jgi:hypothetical protein
VAPAIVIVGDRDEVGPAGLIPGWPILRKPCPGSLDLLGRPLVDRAVDALLQSGIEEIRALVCDGLCAANISQADKTVNVAGPRLWDGVFEELRGNS